MRYKIIAIGKIKAAYLREGIADYCKRLRNYGGVTIVEVPEGKIGTKVSSKDVEQLLTTEGEQVLSKIGANDYVMLLDLAGKNISSTELAADLAGLGVAGVGEVVFVIGGAYGVGENLRKRANRRISFGRLTYTHQMVRYLLVEQLYRAEKINHHEPYHW